MSKNSWESLAKTYEEFSLKEDSFDTLLDYPAQPKAVGDVKGKKILDLACGSGRKAFNIAISGAKKVVCIDISSKFIDMWKNRKKPSNLFFCQGNLSSLEEIQEIADEQFDLAICFQAMGYSTNLNNTILFIRSHLVLGGRFILTTAHPFRFAIEKNESEGIPPGEAYRDESFYSYPSSWNKNIIVSHSTPMISTYINTLLSNGFRLDSMTEPDLTKEQKEKYPNKAEWLAKYVGIVVYELTAI
ncbi:MAG: class I SAM-dependent methyltransferase [Planctomycetota bacterium]|jgi:SAM-dependent methyltransferase